MTHIPTKARPRQPFDAMPRSQQAGILCNDDRFRRFVATRLDLPQASASAAAEFIRHLCRVASRRHIDHSPPAARRFDALRTEFDAWVGRIPAQR